MAQNRSSAVMQQRHEAPDSLDDFPTPPWASRALCEELVRRGHQLHLHRAWEPACNRGYMAAALAEYFDQVHATDVHDYGWPGQACQADFLIDWGQDAPDVDWVVTNPPFRLAGDFIRQALRHAKVGVAVFVRSAFIEGQERYASLFRDQPESLFMPFVERVALWRGVLLDPERQVWRDDPDGGGLRYPTSATSYAWLVWIKSMPPGATLMHRIGPCRRELTRPADYPPIPEHLRPPGGGLL